MVTGITLELSAHVAMNEREITDEWGEL